VTAAVAVCLVLMGLPQMGGGGGRDLQGSASSDGAVARTFRSHRSLHGRAPAEIPQVRVRVASRKKPIDKTALVKVILCAFLSLRS
jgi:hypothetical protein